MMAEEFNIDLEGNFPSMYSALTLLLCSVLLSIISSVHKENNNRYAKHWKILSFIFLYLSLDEMLSLHEHVVTPLRNLGFSGFFYHAWVVAAAIILPIFCLSFLRFFLNLERKTRTLFFVSFILFVGGAFDLELVGGNYADSYGAYNMGYKLLVTFEELLEMSGIVVFVHTLLLHLNFLNIKELDIEVELKHDKSTYPLSHKGE